MPPICEDMPDMPLRPCWLFDWAAPMKFFDACWALVPTNPLPWVLARPPTPLACAA
jgi:hypothetical protein